MLDKSMKHIQVFAVVSVGGPGDPLESHDVTNLQVEKSQEAELGQC